MAQGYTTYLSPPGPDKGFKNLRDFSIDFDEKQLTTVLIGQNGTGKSNLFEALVLIFRALDLWKRSNSPSCVGVRYAIRP